MPLLLNFIVLLIFSTPDRCQSYECHLSTIPDSVFFRDGQLYFTSTRDGIRHVIRDVDTSGVDTSAILRSLRPRGQHDEMLHLFPFNYTYKGMFKDGGEYAVARGAVWWLLLVQWNKGDLQITPF